MTWLLRTRAGVVLTMLAWLVIVALPVQVPYPTLRAGIQWIEVGAVTAILPLFLWLWHRWQLEDERAVNSVRMAPLLLDVALVASMPLGAAALVASGLVSAASAVVPSMFLGALTLIAGIPGIPRAAAAVPTICLAIAILLGDRPEGGHQPWALATMTHPSGGIVLGVALSFALASSCALAPMLGRMRAVGRS